MVNLHEIKVIDYLELNIVAENAIEVSRDRKSLCESAHCCLLKLQTIGHYFYMDILKMFRTD
jgi:hypothetical protein